MIGACHQRFKVSFRSAVCLLSLPRNCKRGAQAEKIQSYQNEEDPRDPQCWNQQPHVNGELGSYTWQDVSPS